VSSWVCCIRMFEYPVWVKSFWCEFGAYVQFFLFDHRLDFVYISTGLCQLFVRAVVRTIEVGLVRDLDESSRVGHACTEWIEIRKLDFGEGHDFGSIKE